MLLQRQVIFGKSHLATQLMLSHPKSTALEASDFIVPPSPVQEDLPWDVQNGFNWLEYHVALGRCLSLQVSLHLCTAQNNHQSIHQHIRQTFPSPNIKMQFLQK